MLEVVCCDLTLRRRLFNSTGAAVEFLGRTEETNSLFQYVRLLDWIRDDK